MTPAEFRTIRLAAGLSQTGLAKLLALQHSPTGSVTVSRYETGARPILQRIAMLMRLLERDGADAVKGLTDE